MLWYEQLKDLDYNVVQTGVNKWVSTHKWSPTIAEIREMAHQVSRGELPDWGTAWDQVLKAISRFGSYRPQEALASMTPLARKTVERLGFINICMSENIAADRANFRMIYEELAEREAKEALIPASIREQIQEIQTNLMIEEVEKR